MLKRAWNALARKTEHWSRFRLGLTIGVVAVAATAIGIAASAAAVVATGTESFCGTSCHSMHPVRDEYKGTIHDKNRTGVRAGCADCHIPHDSVVNMLTVKTVSGIRDIWGHYVTGVIDTKEKFEKHRYRLAVMVCPHLKKNDSTECRSCHDRAGMDPDLQSDAAKENHGKAKAQGYTCIDCHFGIAHNEPDGPGPKELKIAK